MRRSFLHLLPAKFLLLACALLASCGGTGTNGDSKDATPEAQLRARLGIPPEAPAAMIFAQNSHLDPDWQMTFDDYYRVFVKDIFVEDCDLLAAQPRAFYSISEMCYLKHHLAVHPEELPLFQSAAGRRGGRRARMEPSCRGRPCSCRVR